MKDYWKPIIFGVVFIVLIAFMIWAMFYQRDTQKNVYERDEHNYDRIFIQTSPHIVHSPDCELCKERLDSIIKAERRKTLQMVDSILEANGLKRQ